MLPVHFHKCDQREIVYCDEDFRTLGLLAEDGIIRVDKACVIRFANPAMLRMLGLESESEILGKSLLNFVAASDYGKVKKKFIVRGKGTAGSYALSFVRKDDTAFPSYVSTVPLFSEGAFEGSFAIVKDMTREEHFVKRLRSSETRFRNLLRQLPAAICEMNPDSSIRYVNDFARRLLGIEGLCGRHSLRSFVPADELPCYDKMIAETFGGIEHQPFLMDLLVAGGERLATLWSVARATKRGGSPRASVVIVDLQGIVSAAYTYSERFFEPFGLTAREQAVARRLISGSIYKEIASELGLSLSTVRTHTMSLYRKMNIHSRDELVDLVRCWQIGHGARSELIEGLCHEGSFHYRQNS
jgi:PAS domain S-box-containing protein